MKHAFTVDVEDWFHGIPIDGETKRSAERRLDRGLDRLLELLGAAGVKATFFFLGPVARDYPHQVRAIAAEGHELGCHGWSHDLLYEMERARFVEETRRAADTIAGIAGREVPAYRAAYFSLTKRSLWALEELAGLGFRYDSSISPVRTWRYGISGFNHLPRRIETPAGPVVEFPLSVRTLGGRAVPVSGGAYFRIYPYAFSRRNLLALEASGVPALFYVHPWELDPDHPRIRFDWRARLTHYANLRRTLPRLRRLLEEFRFTTLSKSFEAYAEGPSRSGTSVASW